MAIQREAIYYTELKEGVAPEMRVLPVCYIVSLLQGKKPQRVLGWTAVPASRLQEGALRH